MKLDYFRAGMHVPPTALWYGNLDLVELWHQKTLAAAQEIDLPTTKLYSDEIIEVNNAWQIALPVLIMVGMVEESSLLLTSWGFTWDADGFHNLDFFHAAMKAVHAPNQDNPQITWCRLIVYIVSPPDSINETEVDTWIPSPKELADMERTDFLIRTWGLCDLTSFGARAFLKLGRDDDAYELSRIAVSPEQKTQKTTTLLMCHSILGQVAARRGNLDEAKGHFANALKEAKISRLPMMEVIVARDWKRHLLDPQGLDASEAESVIDGACAVMQKSREQLAMVLSAEYSPDN